MLAQLRGHVRGTITCRGTMYLGWTTAGLDGIATSATIARCPLVEVATIPGARSISLAP